jgi:hypothetical protein
MYKVQSGIYNSTCSELIIRWLFFYEKKKRHWYLKGDAFKQG